MLSRCLGQLLENFVFLSLLRSGAKPNENLFYYQNKSGEEVDFLYFDPDQGVQLVQVCWTLKDAKTYQREIHALTSAAKTFGVTHAKLVSLDSPHTLEEEGIHIDVIYPWTIGYK
jgi:predicted AAA+ superfamily ATPase